MKEVKYLKPICLAAAVLLTWSNSSWGAQSATETAASAKEPTRAARANEPTRAALAAALEKYLARHGDLCLGKYDWPIDVNAHDVAIGARDALQMPVLEQLGLVSSTDGQVTMLRNDGTEVPVAAKRYELTKLGERFYLPRETKSVRDGQPVVHHRDFCAGKVSVEKIVNWTPPTSNGGPVETTVSYTYKFAAAQWMHMPQARKVFPMVARIDEGQGGSLKLEQRLRLNGKEWVGVGPND